MSISHSLNRSASPSIDRWRHELLHLTGCSPEEVADKLDVLIRFCASQGVSPETIVNDCRRGPDPIQRRAYYLSATRETGAKLVLQSFLIHNGVNVFGDLVCMPATTDTVVREQGEQWAGRQPLQRT